MKRWIVLKAVFQKSLIEMKRYLFNTLSGVLTMYIIFVMLFLGARFIGGGALQLGGSFEGLVVGYLVWMMALVAYQDLAYNISGEAEMGTLEQLYLSPAGFSWVNGSFLVTRFLVNLVLFAVILFLMMLTTGQWLHVDLLALLPLTVVTVAPAYGFGFVMAGLALVFKRIQNSFQILQFIFVAFVIVPIGNYAWIKFMPLALGSDLMRRIMVDGLRIWQLPAADLGLALAVGVAYFLAGLAAFGHCARVARDRGMLGQY